MRRDLLKVRFVVSIWLASAVSLVSCAGDPPPEAGQFPTREQIAEDIDAATTARDRERVDAMLDSYDQCMGIDTGDLVSIRVLELLYIAIYDDLEPPFRGEASLRFDFGDHGELSRVEVLRPDTPRTEAILSSAIEEIKPFPPPPDADADCLFEEDFEIPYEIVRETLCAEEPDVRSYYLDFERRIYRVLYSEEYMRSPGRGFVAFEMKFDREGAVASLDVTRARDPLARAKLERAARAAISIGEPPMFDKCFDGEAWRYHLDVQGTP